MRARRRNGLASGAQRPGAKVTRPPNVRQTKEWYMPILLWVGLPVILLGGGYAILHFAHAVH
jgi:hypothetical protein